MSSEVSSRVWRLSKAKNNARFVLVALADEANDEGVVETTNRRLCEKLGGMSERGLRVIVRQLEQLGELSCEVHAGVRSGNTYRILLGPRGAECAPFPTQEGQQVPLAPTPPAESAPLTQRGATSAPLKLAACAPLTPAECAPLAVMGQRVPPKPAEHAPLAAVASAARRQENPGLVLVTPETSAGVALDKAQNVGELGRRSRSPGSERVLGSETSPESDPEASPEDRGCGGKRTPVHPAASAATRKSSLLRTFGDDDEPMVLARHLRMRILDTLSTAKVPQTPAQLQGWARTFDLMLRVDGRSAAGIEAVIDFAHRDPFWRANVLGADAVRRHYDRLEVQREQRQSGRRTGACGRRAGADAVAPQQRVGTPEYYAAARERERLQMERQRQLYAARHPGRAADGGGTGTAVPEQSELNRRCRSLDGTGG